MRNTDIEDSVIISIPWMFQGNVAQFQDTFFDNAFREEIKDWAKTNQLEVHFSDEQTS